MGSKKHRRKQQAQQQAQAAPAPTGASQQQQRQQYAPASMLPQGGIPYMTAGDTMGWQPVAAACVGLPAGWEAQLLKQIGGLTVDDVQRMQASPIINTAAAPLSPPAAAAAHLVFGPSFAAIQQQQGLGVSLWAQQPPPPPPVPNGTSSSEGSSKAGLPPPSTSSSVSSADSKGASMRAKAKARPLSQSSQSQQQQPQQQPPRREAFHGGRMGQIVVAPPSEHICATEYWESMAGPEALLPSPHLLQAGNPAAAQQQLKEAVDAQLLLLEEEGRDARDRCRLAHTLGNLALTPAGDELFHHDPVYVRRFYGVIRGVAALYARQWAEERKAGMSDTVVPRPCVAGYCMLALACLVKREAQERWFLRRMGRMQQQEKEEGGGGFSVVGFLLGPEDPFASLRCMEGAAVAGGRPPTEEPGQEEEGGEEEELGPDGLGRLRVLWRMLVHLTRESRRSRGALRSLALNLELLSSLELASARYHDHQQQQRRAVATNRPFSLLDLVPFPSPERARLQIARAASLVLRYTGSRADACAAAHALHLFGVFPKAPRLFERGGPGYQAFTGGKGIASLMRALGSMSTAPQEATDRLSLLACASDLGPAHPELALPGAPLLLKWATVGGADKSLQQERAYATLALARMLDPALIGALQAAVVGGQGGEEEEEEEEEEAHGTLYGPPTRERDDKVAAEAVANTRFLARMGALPVALRCLGEYAALVKDCRPVKEEEEEDSWLYGLAGYSGYTGGNGNGNGHGHGHGGVEKEKEKQEETKGGLWHAERVGAALTLLTHLLAFDEASLHRCLTDAAARSLCIGSCAFLLLRCIMPTLPHTVRRVVGTQCLAVLVTLCGRSADGLQLLLQQHPYALVAVRRTLLLDGGPAIAAAFAALFAPPTTKQPDGPPDVPSPALRLAIHLATLSVIFSPIQTEEGENGHSPERPAFATAALPLLPTHIDLPPSSATTPCWLDRLTTAVLTHRGSSVLLPSSSPPDACDGWEWSGDGMARALRALGRAAAMREQACDLQPLHALYAAGGAPALLDCLLVDVDGEVVEGVAAAAAEAAAAIPPPSATGNGSGRKRNREEQEEKEGKIEGGWSMQDVTAALRAAELNSRARGVITGCAMCAQEEGQGQGGNLLRCARCKAARYCSRECQVRHWKDHRRICAPDNKQQRQPPSA